MTGAPFLLRSPKIKNQKHKSHRWKKNINIIKNNPPQKKKRNTEFPQTKSFNNPTFSILLISLPPGFAADAFKGLAIKMTWPQEAGADNRMGHEKKGTSCREKKRWIRKNHVFFVRIGWNQIDVENVWGNPRWSRKWWVFHIYVRFQEGNHQLKCGYCGFSPENTMILMMVD